MSLLHIVYSGGADTLKTFSMFIGSSSSDYGYVGSNSIQKSSQIENEVENNLDDFIDNFDDEFDD